MKYTYKLSSDNWGLEITIFDSIEDCINHAKEKYNSEAIFEIHIAEAVIYETHISGINIIEMLKEQLDNDDGDYSEDWLDDLEKPIINDLEERMTSLVTNWLKENNREPNFYTVKNIKKIFVQKEHELKPCPFCGGNAVVVHAGENLPYFIACDHCYASGWRYYELDEAIEAWNCRVQEGEQNV